MVTESPEVRLTSRATSTPPTSCSAVAIAAGWEASVGFLVGFCVFVSRQAV